MIVLTFGPNIILTLLSILFIASIFVSTCLHKEKIAWIWFLVNKKF